MENRLSEISAARRVRLPDPLAGRRRRRATTPMLTTSASFEGCFFTSRVLGATFRVLVAFVFVALVDRDLVAAGFRVVDLLLCCFVVRFAGVAALTAFFTAGFLTVDLLVLPLVLAEEARVVLAFV